MATENGKGVLSIEAFVPAKDLVLSTKFYQELGFDLVSENSGMNILAIDGHRFFLQDYHVKEWAENQVLQLKVTDVDQWWQRIEQLGLEDRYDGVRLMAPVDQPWGMRELNIIDPAGVCWHVATPI